MPWQPGQSGNPGGRSREKPWADALRAVVNMEDKHGRKQLLAIAERCVAAALAGDMMAIKEIGNRLDGLPIQQLEGTGDKGELTIRWLKPGEEA